jgi:hypothetical protein
LADGHTHHRHCHRRSDRTLGTTQHLRALMAIRGEGGLVLGHGDRLVPEPVLLGRDPAKLAALAAAYGGLKWTTDRDLSLADPDIAIYFDASATGGRPERAGAAIAAGKHVYLEKADRRDPIRCAGFGAARASHGPQGGRRAGQVVPAGAAQA